MFKFTFVATALQQRSHHSLYNVGSFHLQPAHINKYISEAPYDRIVTPLTVCNNRRHNQHYFAVRHNLGWYSNKYLILPGSWHRFRRNLPQFS